MSTEPEVLVLAKQTAANRYAMSDHESGEYVVGFLDGWAGSVRHLSLERMHAERWRDLSERAWWTMLEAMLLLEPTHPARQKLEDGMKSYIQ